MMVRVRINQFTAIVIYLLAMTGISFLGSKLASIVVEQAIVLALPYLDNGPPNLSLIERRRIDAMLSVRPLSEGERKRIATLEIASLSTNVLAGRLYFADEEALADAASSAHLASAADGLLEPTSEPSSIAARVSIHRIAKSRTVSSSSRYATLTARDIFNRSFGVLSWRQIE